MAIAGSIDFSSGVRKANMNGVLERSAVDRLPVFATLPQEARASLVAESTVRHYARKSTLVVEGAVPGHVFVVLQGRIRAVRRSESGREVTLETYQPGDVLVDAFAAPGRALMNDWEIGESTELLSIAPQVFASFVNMNPSIAVTLMGQMLQRIDVSKGLAAGLALTDVPERVVAALKSLALSRGEETVEGVMIPHRPTQQELANSIGACRETVSRVVSDLTRKGLIAPVGKSLMVTRQLLKSDPAA